MTRRTTPHGRIHGSLEERRSFNICGPDCQFLAHALERDLRQGVKNNDRQFTVEAIGAERVETPVQVNINDSVWDIFAAATIIAIITAATGRVPRLTVVRLRAVRFDQMVRWS